MRRRFTADEKKRFVDEVRAGVSVMEAARRRGLTSSLGYRWMRAAEDAGAPRFAQLVPAASVARAAISIRVGAATVQVEAGFDAELLRSVVAALDGSSK